MSSIKPTWQDWHDKSKALLESQTFKEYEKAITIFRQSDEFRNYEVARIKMFNNADKAVARIKMFNKFRLMLMSEEELQWESRGVRFITPYDIKYAHETWGEKIYTSMKWETP